MKQIPSSPQPSPSPTTDPSLRLARQLQSGFIDDRAVSQTFIDQLEQRILDQTARPHPTAQPVQPAQWWRILLFRIGPVGAIAGVIGIAIMMQSQTTTPPSTTTASVATDHTNAIVATSPDINTTINDQNVPVLHGATITNEGNNNGKIEPSFDSAAFQNKLRESNKTSEDLLYDVESDTTKEYATIIKSGKTTLKNYQDIVLFAHDSGADTSALEKVVTDMQAKIDTWPTADAPFDAVIHKQMIDDFVSSNKAWNAAVEIYLQQFSNTQ